MIVSSLKGGLFNYEVKDYYAILGVPVFSNPKDIRLRYLKLAYQLHPDTNRAESQEKRDKSSEILSKLVNPAYENLYKDKPRKECELILTEISTRLAPIAEQINLSGEITKKLFREENNLEKMYREIVESLAKEQYQDLNKLAIKISILSELNMVYLVRQKQGSLSGKTITPINSNPTISASEPIITEAPASYPEIVAATEGSMSNNQPSQTTPANAPVSRLERLINSAKSHVEQYNPDAAIFDLKEAVKLDANSAEVHGLLGLCYLQQGNIPYGRIHTNKAIALDKNNPTAKKAQEELKTLEKKSKSGGDKDNKSKPDSKAQKPTDKSQAKGKEKDGKKKEAPKIFGIPLW